jgi:glucose-6-phosphate-specific signal transduction histidine kinase
MPLWQRLTVTLIAMLAAGLVAGLIWRWLFAAPLPDYLGGLTGGLVALPVWEFLKRVRPRTSDA